MTTVYCVGRNYAKHAAELGSQTPESPIWFLKPEASIVGPGKAIILPDVGRVDHEVELALRIGADGRPDAMTIAIDVTARDMQSAAKKAGRPWAQSKGYDTFLPLGDWVDLVEDLGSLQLRLRIGGDVRQDASTRDMTWPVERLLEHLATWTTPQPGDIILTGTPEGVGPLRPGDVVDAEIVGHATLRVLVERSAG